MLTPEQRAGLEKLGPATVRAKLSQPGAGRGAALQGFEGGIYGGQLTRGDVEDWLAEKFVDEQQTQTSTLWWARIAGWAGIVSVAVGIIAIIVSIWLAR